MSILSPLLLVNSRFFSPQVSALFVVSGFIYGVFQSLCAVIRCQAEVDYSCSHQAVIQVGFKKKKITKISLMSISLGSHHQTHSLPYFNFTAKFIWTLMLVALSQKRVSHSTYAKGGRGGVSGYFYAKRPGLCWSFSLKSLQKKRFRILSAQIISLSSTAIIKSLLCNICDRRR